MVADELRRQADEFIDISHLASTIGRDPIDRPDRSQKPQERRPTPAGNFDPELAEDRS
jgi:hypothetical protein